MATNPDLLLKRFLHYGRETSLYQPGNRILNKYFEPNCITSVEALIADGRPADAVVHIVKAFSDGYSAHSEALVYALACCVRQKSNDALRQNAYKAFKKICKSVQNFFLFVKFSTELSSPTRGWGHGCRKVVIDWYVKQNPLELAENVTRYRGIYFWTHRDIIKLAHPKTEDVAMKAVLKYVMKGIKEAREEFGGNPLAQPVLTYLQAVEDFKHSKEEEWAARVVEQHKLCLEHVPPQFIKSKEVWAALIPNMPLPTLLRNLKRLGRLRFLRTNHPVMIRVVEALGNQAAITEGSVHPAQVLIALRSYEQSGRLKYVDPNRELKPLVQPNPKIIEALNTLLESSFKSLVPTGLRYLVMVDTRSPLVTGHCWQCTSVPPLHAAALIALSLVKTERNVTVLAFGLGVPTDVPLSKTMTLVQAQEKLREVPTTSVDFGLPFSWATENKKEIDVFICITDSQVRAGRLKAAEELKKYRESLNMPNSKFVVCGLTCPKFSIASEDDPGMLDIAGFDEQVPRVIEAFSRGAF
ncbi:60 kDa SS-A/Ro ribonucleoprotein [Gryllus bimaculatus]|nr:60 kDa SS-A/Ro ribonucleoprotein [Gryllus bimaculatus]